MFNPLRFDKNFCKTSACVASSISSIVSGQYAEIPDSSYEPSILNTNLRTATVSAYHGAQWQRLQELKDVYPAYQCKTVGDNRVRDEHAILADKIFQANDPIWNKIYPPNGWNCRCYVNALSSDELNDVKPDDRVALTNIEERSSLVKNADIPKEFQRNSGQAESIWGKWLETKFKDLDYNKKFKEVFDYSRSVGRYQEKNLIDSILEKDKTDFIQKELTQNSWDDEFPNNETDTPFGIAKITGDKNWKNQLEKMLNKEDERYKFFGLIKPTLNNPAMIIRDDRGGLVFVKKFEGKSEIIFMAIGYENGKIIKVVSLSPRQLRDIVTKLENGEVLHFSASALSESADSVRKHSAISGGLLKFDSNVRSDSDTVNPEGVNELWGEFISIGKTRVRKIRYKVEGFEVSVDDGDFALKKYSEIDNYRKGVLMQ